MSKKIIFYIGKDDIFLEQMKQHYGTYLVHSGPYQFNNHQNYDFCEKFFKLLLDMEPHMIIFDISIVESSLEIKGGEKELLEKRDEIYGLTRILEILSNHFLFSAVPMFLLVKEKESIFTLQYLFSQGLIYAYVKGKFNKEFFTDTFYISFEDTIRFPKYALAYSLTCQFQLQSLAIITGFTSDHIKIENDINFSESEKVNIAFNEFSDLKQREFNIITYKQNATLFKHSSEITVQIPFTGPWDDPDENSIFQETIETWMDMNSNDFVPEKSFALIIDSREDEISSFFHMKEEEKLRVLWRGYMDKEFHVLDAIEPKIIFYQVDVEEDEIDENGTFNIFNVENKDEDYFFNDLQHLSKMINHIKIQKYYRPIIFVFGAPSTDRSFQLVFDYEKLLCVKEDLKIESIKKFTSIYKSQVELENVSFSKTDPRQSIGILTDIIITSITEHEITFHSKKIIPYYSVLRTDFPIPMFVTIIPPIRDIKSNSLGNHYMGFLHSITEENRQYLRQFINKIIFEPPEENSPFNEIIFDEKDIKDEKEYKNPYEDDEIDEEQKKVEEELEKKQKEKDLKDKKKSERYEVRRSMSKKFKSKL